MGPQSLFLVVNRTSAKIFEISRRPDSLTWVKTMKNSLGSTKNKLMTKDKPGMSRGKYAKSNSPHALTHERNPHEDVAVTFAKKISIYLKKNLDNNEVLNLTIAAEPHMLGLVKKAVKQESFTTPIKWMRKDLEKLTTDKLENVIFKKPKKKK